VHNQNLPSIVIILPLFLEFFKTSHFLSVDFRRADGEIFMRKSEDSLAVSELTRGGGDKRGDAGVREAGQSKRESTSRIIHTMVRLDGSRQAILEIKPGHICN